ncbi:NTF2-related export protein [Diplonema papillatum]|nr:NTF2-related export protein [Diplonema papillatum]
MVHLTSGPVATCLHASAWQVFVREMEERIPRNKVGGGGRQQVGGCREMASLARGGAVVHDEKVIVAACKDASQLLKEFYYPTWDSQSSRSGLSKLYHETATTIWNGEPVGRNEIDQLLAKIPSSKHVIASLDVQPIQDSCHFLLSVHGKCSYAGSVHRSFHQQFVAWKEEVHGSPTRFWIMHDCFRWIGEEES